MRRCQVTDTDGLPCDMPLLNDQDVCRTHHWYSRFKQQQKAKERAYNLAHEQADRATEAEKAITQTARWLQDGGFPFDYRTDEPPPDPLYKALVTQCAVRDRVTFDTCADFIADYTGWPRAEP